MRTPSSLTLRSPRLAESHPPTASEANDMSDEISYQHLFGWRGVDDLQRSFASQFPTLAQSAPHLVGGPAPTEPILLYKAWRDVLGKDPAYPAQQIGDCVSFGHGHGNDLLQCIEIGLGASGGLPGDGHRVHLRDVAGGRRHPGPPGRLVRRGRGQGDDDDRDGQPGDAGRRRQLLRATGQGVGPLRSRPHPSSRRPGRSSSGRRRRSRPGTNWSRRCGTATPSRSAPPRASPWTATPTASARPGAGGGTACSSPGSGSTGRVPASSRAGARILPAARRALDQPSFSFWADQPVVERILGEGDSWALSKSPAFEKRELPPAWKYHDAA